MGDLLRYAVQGIPAGCVFALLAVGLVLTFKASGVFNLAFAAQAYVSAAVFYSVRKEDAWPLVPAAVLAILVVAPIVGLLFDRLLFRHLRTASSGAKLISSIGLLVAVPELVKLWFGSDSKKNPPPLWWVERSDQWLWPQSGRFVLDAGQIATIASAAVVAVGLTVLFRWSSIGLQMRAVVESPRMAELNGVNAGRVSGVAWILSSVLAGLSGVLLAPLFAALNSLDFFTLLVAALAAAVFGRLVNIPMAFAGGLALGVLQAILAGTLPTDSIVATGLRPALPFVVLFALLLLYPGLKSIRDVADPLAGVDPPPPPPAASLRTPAWATVSRVATALAVVGGVAIGWFVLDAFWLGLIISGVALGVILLSITIITGLGGMVSLCQPTFAAMGAFTTAQVTANFGVPVLGSILLGAAVAAVAGGLLALPVLRLDGVYLALATLAFALMFQSIFVPLSWVSGGSVPMDVPRPLVGSIDFAENRRFFVLCVVCLLLVGGLVTLVKRGTMGLYLDALRGSEHAAAAAGIGPRAARVKAFALSAGIAGFGGGLLATYYGSANFDQSFQFFFGLVWVVLVVTVGSRSVPAAAVGGLTFFLMPEGLDRLFELPADYAADHTGPLASVLGTIEPSWAVGFSFILFGFGALSYAKHPEGVMEFQTTWAFRLISRLGSGSGSDSGDRDARRPVKPAGDVAGTDGGPADTVDASPGTRGEVRA